MSKISFSSNQFLLKNLSRISSMFPGFLDITFVYLFSV